MIYYVNSCLNNFFWGGKVSQLYSFPKNNSTKYMSYGLSCSTF